jgi:tetratricopeptide (TPR) repeat protein
MRWQETGRFTGDSIGFEGQVETNSLGHSLREARKNSGLTFAKFALLAGFSESHLRSVENGHRSITPDVARAYDRVLDTGGAFTAAVPGNPHAATGEPLPWDRPGALSAMSGLVKDGGVDRRSFVLGSGTALATTLATHWTSALATPLPLPAGSSRQVSPGLVAHIGQRLDHLRHLDDELGSGDLAALARSELALIVRLLRTGSYTDQASRRLYSLAAEASRQVAWDYFDQAHHESARLYFEAALRASAAGSDPCAGAYALSFMAVQCYSTGHAQQAISLLETAQSTVTRRSTPRMTAMLAARTARAWSKTGSRRVCARLLHQARSALDHGPHPDDPDTLYWVTHGEIEMIAGSSALDLGDPAEAIRRFDAAISADYPGDSQYPRSHAIYLCRAAEAHLALHDLDAAVDRATHAMRCLGGVDSARSSAALVTLRAKLTRHASASVVREFLNATA